MNSEVTQFSLKTNENFRICKIEEKLTPEFFTIHQHKYFEIILFTQHSSKKLQHNIDFISYPIVQNRAYFISQNQTHQWNLKEFDNSFKGYFITFDASFIQAEETLIDLFDFLQKEPFIELETNEKETLITLIQMIETAKKKNTKYIKSLLESILYYLSDRKSLSSIPQNLNQQRFIKLRKLIDLHYKKEKFVYFYAKKMKLSTKRLNEVIKGISNQSVTELIHQRVILEAKRKLSLKIYTIQDIAYDLGFNDPTYFSRFFKKVEGLSPNNFLLLCENNTTN